MKANLVEKWQKNQKQKVVRQQTKSTLVDVLRITQVSKTCT